MNTTQVHPIDPHECYGWIKKRHYAKRKPSIVHAFGLYLDHLLIGVITYGIPPINNLNQIAGFPAIELNRLCIEEGAPKNSASILVGRSLCLLPRPLVVISYADQTQGHVGYIYQATNWLYTGEGSRDIEFEKDGKTYHRKSLFNTFGSGGSERLLAMGYSKVQKDAKHRYLFFLGSKREKKQMLTNLKWPVLPYPKGETHRYDASAEIHTQMKIFF